MTSDRAASPRPAPEKPHFSALQGAQALGRCGLRPLTDWREVRANPINCLYRAECGVSSVYYLKVQPQGGFSLETEATATELLAAATALPVSGFCHYEASPDILGCPYLVIGGLPGVEGRAAFEAAGDGDRCDMLRQFGEATAVIHLVSPAPDTDLPVRDLSQWRQTIETKLLGNQPLVSSLPPEGRSRLPAIAAALDRIDLDLEPVPQGVLWGDAALHNLLYDENGQVSGVLDFENAGFGDLLVDQLHVVGDFQVRAPREIYSQPHYLEAFWSGYLAAGGSRIEPGSTYLRVRTAAQKAGSICWFWHVLGAPHRRTGQWLDELEGALLELAEK